MPALVAGFTISIVFAAVLSIVLTAAGPDGIGLSDARTSGWIVVLYGWPVLPSLFLTLHYRTPLLLTGNIFALLFFASLGNQVGFEELAGAAMLAGALVLAISLLGLARQLAAWIPVPIVHGVIAGAVLPFVVGIFSSLRTGDADGADIALIVGAAVLAFLVAHVALGGRLPAILPAFVAGSVVAIATGELGAIPDLALASIEPVVPSPSWEAAVTITPVLVALMTVQSNIPSVIYLRSQGFDPPERLIDVLSGAGTIVGSMLGPVPVSLALPPLLLAAGPAAGERALRYRSVFLPIAAGLLIALFAGTAADLAVFLPPVLLLTMAGLALLPALTAALREIAAGPLVLGPVFAFAIALSEMSLFGLGPFFWSLVLGTLVSRIFEREAWAKLPATGAAA